jgi:hypothetical protein
MNIGMLRTRWAAVGAAVAVTLGAGSIGIGYATSPTGAAAFVPITPCRVVDTRPAPDTVGSRTSPIGPNETFTVDAHGSNGDCTGIPAGATGLSLNVTALGATSGTFLTLWPTGATQPTASNLNPQPGQPPIPNAVTTGLSAGGQFNIYNKVGSVNVIVDIVGYYTDHNHDDRYYTETEVDAAIAAAGPVAIGYVNANGTLSGGEGVVSSSWDAGLSRYVIDLDASYFFSSYATTVTTTCDAHLARTDSVGGNLLVIITNGANASAQCGFGFIVYDI